MVKNTLGLAAAILLAICPSASVLLTNTLPGQPSAAKALRLGRQSQGRDVGLPDLRVANGSQQRMAPSSQAKGAARLYGLIMSTSSIASRTRAIRMLKNKAGPYASLTLIVSRGRKLTVFVSSVTDVFVMSSQPLAVRNEQTGQPAAGNPVEPEVVADQGASGPFRCGNTSRFELVTASGALFWERVRGRLMFGRLKCAKESGLQLWSSCDVGL